MLKEKNQRTTLPILLLSLVMGNGCSGTTHSIPISIGKPKVYDENTVFKIMNSQLEVIKKLEMDTTIKPETLTQEFSAKRFKRQTEGTLGASPLPPDTDEALVGQNQNSASAPSLIGTTVISPPSNPFDFKNANTSLALQNLVRKRTVFGEHILSQKLLNEGDNHLFHNPKYRPLLVRLDITFNGYHPGKTGFFTKDFPQFVVVPFKITPTDSPTTENTDECSLPTETSSSVSKDSKKASNQSPAKKDEVVVYSLSPSYDSIVSKESLLEEQIDIFTTQLTGFFSGITGQVNGRNQSAQAEDFLTSIEQPLQFGMSSDKPNEFAVAFGPRRVLKKNGLIKNYILWQGPYDITYRFDPGPREVSFIVLVPNNTKGLKIEYSLDSDTTPFDLYPKSPHYCKSKTIEIDEDSFPKIANNEFIPKQINPAVESTHLIFSKKRIQPGTLVKVGNRFIRDEDTIFLGPHKLAVKMAPLTDTKKLSDEKKKLEEEGISLIFPDGKSQKLEDLKGLGYLDTPKASTTSSPKLIIKDSLPVLPKDKTYHVELSVPKNWKVGTINFGNQSLPFIPLPNGNHILRISENALKETGVTHYQGRPDVFTVPITIEYTDEKNTTQKKKVDDFIFLRSDGA